MNISAGDLILLFGVHRLGLTNNATAVEAATSVHMSRPLDQHRYEPQVAVLTVSRRPIISRMATSPRQEPYDNTGLPNV
ncbi:Hypothetical protein NTJ_10692 [Nesidiocoris tenuis]|uniref:Uncharacterized protein n=1 Tax=Nesidiocoris tenuis TaxID=355587 RepID=A0ABN7B0W8_9HEMI|nr:Hypothetical protein NTJ_10692 [Nesidiocoris tenuis]